MKEYHQYNINKRLLDQQPMLDNKIIMQKEVVSRHIGMTPRDDSEVSSRR